MAELIGLKSCNLQKTNKENKYRKRTSITVLFIYLFSLTELFRDLKLYFQLYIFSNNFNIKFEGYKRLVDKQAISLILGIVYRLHSHLSLKKWVLKGI